MAAYSEMFYLLEIRTNGTPSRDSMIPRVYYWIPRAGFIMDLHYKVLY